MTPTPTPVETHLGDRRIDFEGWVHFPSVGVQTGLTLCNAQFDTDEAGRGVAMKATKKPATCNECLSIVAAILNPES